MKEPDVLLYIYTIYRYIQYTNTYTHVCIHTYVHRYIHTYIYIQSIDVGKITNFCRHRSRVGIRI